MIPENRRTEGRPTNHVRPRSRSGPYDYDDDERFYGETVYNEEYYIERERELIRQSNLDLELEELEERHIRKMREEGLLRPVLIKPGESNPEAEKESSLNQPEIEIPF